MTPGEAIRVALRLQPDIAASAADRDAASERLQQANARFLPTITPQYTYISNYTFVDAGRFSNGQGGDQVSLPRSSTRETRQGDLSLRYLLYDSGQRQTSARQARSSLRAAEFGEQDTRLLVIANVADRYFAVLRTRPWSGSPRRRWSGRRTRSRWCAPGRGGGGAPDRHPSGRGGPRERAGGGSCRRATTPTWPRRSSRTPWALRAGGG